MENKERIEKINIKEVLPPRVLLKKHSKMQIEELCDSIKEFGQYRPILLQESSNRIICGYGVYLALKKLKIREILVKKIDVNDEEADNIRFTDNYSNESSKWNEDKLQYLFMEMPDELIKISGFETEEVENIFNDSIELLKRGLEKSLEMEQKAVENNNFEEKDEEDEDIDETNEEIIESEKKIENNSENVKKIKNVEFVKIKYCGCCGKYYDSEGNELDLLR